jgi:glycosyltransferase involved in cell wall biosynthesis/Tfp pilus assembly protein PilF
LENTAQSPKITLCVITYNEEEMLFDCLQSACNWVDQIVVADTGSTDKTVEIAKKFGAKVIHHRWLEDFSAARNEALEYAEGDWILVLDADERLVPEDGEQLRMHAQLDDFDCGLISIHNATHAGATWEQISSGLARRSDPILLPRFLRHTEDLKWEGVVHENVTTWLGNRNRTKSINTSIIHLGNIPKIRRERKKSERNLRLLERRCILEPNNPIARTRLARELLRVGDEMRALQEVEWSWMDLSVLWSKEEASIRPNPTEVATLRAFLSLNHHNPQAALDTADQAINWGDNHPNIHLLRAAALEQLEFEDPVEEQRALRSAHESTIYCLSVHGTPTLAETLPGATSWAARTIQGLLYLRQKEFRSAQKCLREALEQRPEHPSARLGLAQALAEQGNISGGLKSLEPLLHSNVAEAWVIAADIAAKQHRYEDVVLFLGRAENNIPEPIACNHRRKRISELKMLCNAWRLYCRTTQSAFQAQEGDANALVEQGEHHFANNDLDSAVARLLQAITVDLMHPTAWQNLAVIAHKLGLADGASDLLEFALKLAPDNVDIRLNLAELQRSTDKRWEAVTTIRQLLTTYPEDVEGVAFLQEMGIGREFQQVALLIDCEGSSKLMHAAADQCRIQGYQIRREHPEIYAALARRQHLTTGNDIHDQLARHRPSVAVIDTRNTRSDKWREALIPFEIPVIVLGHGNVHIHHRWERWVSAKEPELNFQALHKYIPTCAHRALEEKQTPFRSFLSVIIMCRPDGPDIQPTLDSLALQDLDPTMFDVCVMWVGYGAPPALAEKNPYPYQVRHLHQAHPSDASARNQALHTAHAPWIVFFESGAILAPTNLHHHLFGQASTPGHMILVGSRKFSPEVASTAAAKLIESADLWFQHRQLQLETEEQWRHLYLDNVSVPRANLIAAGGFDQHVFPPGTSSCTEFGLRLKRQLGVGVEYDSSIEVVLEQVPTMTQVRRRAYQIGYSSYLCWQKHPYEQAIAIEHIDHPHNTTAFLTLRDELKDRRLNVNHAANVIDKQWAILMQDQTMARKHLQPLIHAICTYETLKGVVHAGTRLPVMPDDETTNLINELTSVILCNTNGSGSIEQTIDSLRKNTHAPTELIVVDNGSSDASLEWLRTQKDIHLIEVGENIGLAAARNRGLEIANGSTILFCSQNILFTPNWREPLIGHLQAWPDIGAVGPVSNIESASQGVDGPSRNEDLERWALDRALTHPDRFQYSTRIHGSCLLIRRDVIDDVGGFDDAFFPHGFEVDDFCVRLGLAGWRLRVVESCYVHQQAMEVEPTSTLNLGTVLAKNWAVFCENWSMDASEPPDQNLDLELVIRRHTYDVGLHRLPYRSAEGYMNTVVPVLLIPYRDLTTPV